jgi:hypothetical protein
MAFRTYHDAFSDAWIKFDTVLVATMVWETWVMTLCYYLFSAGAGGSDATKGVSIFRCFRLIRLARAARATRLLDALPELFVLARGIATGLRAVAAVFMLLGLVIYVFAVVLVMTTKGTDVGGGRLGSVPQAMNVLLLQVLCGPDPDFLTSFLDVGLVYYVFILVFILFAVFTIMNMLIGVLCEAVANIAKEEKDAQFEREVASQIGRLITILDTDNSGTITREEFDSIVQDPELTQRFTDLSVDVVGLEDFAKFVFAQTEEISFRNFAEMVGQFRGSRTATVKDVTDMRRYVSMELIGLENRLENYLVQDILSMLRTLKKNHEI